MFALKMFTPGDCTRTEENLFPAFMGSFSRQTEKVLSSQRLFITSDELREITTDNNKYYFVYLFYFGPRKSGLNYNLGQQTSGHLSNFG